MAKKLTDLTGRVQILREVKTELTLLALIVLILESAYGLTLRALDANLRIYAAWGNYGVILFLIIGLLIILYRRSSPAMPGVASQKQLAPTIIDAALKAVVQAASLPNAPETTNLRMFVFKCEGPQLVCRYLFHPRPDQEQRNITRFDIDSRVAKHVVIVQAFLEKRVIARILDEDERKKPPGLHGKISEQIKGVLAAPIYASDGTIWGTVDFDTPSDAGVSVLKSEVASTTIFQIADVLRQLIAAAEHG